VVGVGGLCKNEWEENGYGSRATLTLKYNFQYAAPASSGIAQSTIIELSVSTICENAGRKSGLA
jgi:hypothetical protein